MILFDLKCDKGHVFEAWFRDGPTCERLIKARKAACAICGSGKVAKAPMAPSIRGTKATTPAPVEAAEARQMLVKLRETVEKNCDYVGPGFAEEARRIHYGETDKRNIYGEASEKDAKALSEEGIEFGRIPWLPRADA